jgi:hypothetical protein
MTQVQHLHKIKPENRKSLRLILIIPQYPIITRKIYTLDSLSGRSSDVVGQNLATYMKAGVESFLSNGMFYTPPEIFKPKVSSNSMSFFDANIKACTGSFTTKCFRLWILCYSLCKEIYGGL